MEERGALRDYLLINFDLSEILTSVKAQPILMLQHKLNSQREGANNQTTNNLLINQSAG
jgi:hypothetical protein